MRIGFVHSLLKLLIDFEAQMEMFFPGSDSFHVLNGAPLDGLRRGERRAQVYRQKVAQLLLASDAGADLIVCTSVSLAPAVDAARLVCKSPIVTVVEPVSAEAVRLGARRIATVCHDPGAAGPAAAALRQQAAIQGQEVIVEAVVRPEAYTALYAGNAERHDAILIEAAEEVSARADLIVLPQATLARLKGGLQHLDIPVLDSVSWLLKDIGRRLEPV